MELDKPLPHLIEKIGETWKPNPDTSSLRNRPLQQVQPSPRVNQLPLRPGGPVLIPKLIHVRIAAAGRNSTSKLP